MIIIRFNDERVYESKLINIMIYEIASSVNKIK